MTGIAEWLKTVGLDKYAHVFAEHELTLDLLPHLTESDIDQLGLRGLFVDLVIAQPFDHGRHHSSHD